MAVEERAWSALHDKLREVLGAEHTATLMTQIPRGSPATREDLEGVERRLGGRIDGLETEFAHVVEVIELKIQASEYKLLAALHSSQATVRDDIRAQTRMMFFSMFAMLATFAGVVLAAIRLPA